MGVPSLSELRDHVNQLTGKDQGSLKGNPRWASSGLKNSSIYIIFILFYFIFVSVTVCIYVFRRFYFKMRFNQIPTEPINTCNFVAATLAAPVS